MQLSWSPTLALLRPPRKGIVVNAATAVVTATDRALAGVTNALDAHVIVPLQQCSEGKGQMQGLHATAATDHVKAFVVVVLDAKRISPYERDWIHPKTPSFIPGLRCTENLEISIITDVRFSNFNNSKLA